MILDRSEPHQLVDASCDLEFVAGDLDERSVHDAEAMSMTFAQFIRCEKLWPCVV